MKIYKREIYLKKIRGFYDDSEMIKVITGIRRCGKSTLLDMVKNELIDKGIKEKDIIDIKLDKRPYKGINTPEQLEKLIDSCIIDKDFKYLFIDEIQNVKNFEAVIEAYRNEGNTSIFITGSNSYLLSGELITKLTGRKIEIEMLPLNFYEYIEMKKFYKKEVNTNIYLEFVEYIKRIQDKVDSNEGIGKPILTGVQRQRFNQVSLKSEYRIKMLELMYLLSNTSKVETNPFKDLSVLKQKIY